MEAPSDPEQMNDQDAAELFCPSSVKTYSKWPSPIRGSTKPSQPAPSLKGESVLLLSLFHHTSDFLAAWSKEAGDGLFLPWNWEHMQKAPGSPHHISEITVGKHESDACALTHTHPHTQSQTLIFSHFCPGFSITLAPLGM